MSRTKLAGAYTQSLCRAWSTLILSSFNDDITEADLYELADASASGPGPDLTAAQNYIKTYRVVFGGGRIRGKDRPAASR